MVRKCDVRKCDVRKCAAPLRLYLPEDEVTPGFFNLIRIWWLCVNSKERFHPLRQGNALVSDDSKTEFLCSFSNWLISWQDSGKFGMSKPGVLNLF